MARNSANRRTFVKTVGGAATVGLLAGCTGNSGNGGGGSGGTSSGGESSSSGGSTGSAGGNKAPITIGALEPQSGPFAADAKGHLAGLKFAVDEINSNGGIDGHTVKISTADTKATTQTAVNAFTRMISQDDIVAAVGPVASDVGIQTSALAEKQQVPVLLHAAGGVKLAQSDRYTFRVALPPAATCVKAQVQWFKDKNLKKVGGIVESASWGQTFKDNIKAQLPSDFTVVFKDAPVTQSDFSPYLRDMPKDLDVILGSGHPVSLNTMYKQVYNLGFDPKAFPAAIEPAALSYQAIGDLIFKTFAPFFSLDFESDTYKSVAKKYYGATQSFFDDPEACGYVSAKLIEAAINQSGSADAQGVSDGLRKVKLDTVYASPIEYTEYGEMKNVVQTYYGYEQGTPDYYPDGKFKLKIDFRSDPLPALEPQA